MKTKVFDREFPDGQRKLVYTEERARDRAADEFQRRGYNRLVGFDDQRGWGLQISVDPEVVLVKVNCGRLPR